VNLNDNNDQKKIFEMKELDIALIKDLEKQSLTKESIIKTTPNKLKFTQSSNSNTNQSNDYEKSTTVSSSTTTFSECEDNVLVRKLKNPHVGKTHCYWYNNKGIPRISFGPHWPLSIVVITLKMVVIVCFGFVFFPFLSWPIICLSVLLAMVMIGLFVWTFLKNPSLATFMDVRFLSLSLENKKRMYCKVCKIIRWKDVEHCEYCNVCV